MDVNEVLKKYSRKIESEMKGFESVNPAGNPGLGIPAVSEEYVKFKEDMMPELSRYEKWAKGLGSFIKLKLASKDEIKIGKELETGHLNVSASEAVGLAFV